MGAYVHPTDSQRTVSRPVYKSTNKKEKKMNKKRGGWMTVEVVFLVLMTSMSIYSLLPGTREDFQVKKANTLCAQGYKGVPCSEVSIMTKEQILAYIKDDIVVPQYVMSERLGG